jgi:hypothetical protein
MIYKDLGLLSRTLRMIVMIDEEINRMIEKQVDTSKGFMAILSFILPTIQFTVTGSMRSLSL